MNETRFINITLKYPVELYYEQEMPGIPEIFVWTEKLAKGELARFGCKWNPDKSSFIVSYTDYSGSPKDPNPCITAFGGSLLSAYQKLYVMVEVSGYREHGQEVALTNIEAVEFVISKELKKAMGK